MKRMIAFTAAAVCASAGLLPTHAVAQTSDSWQFEAILYGYLPTIKGTTTFPNGAGSSISIDPNEILDHLKMGFLGALEVRKGSWGAYTDVLYLDIGGSTSATKDFTFGGVQLPASASASTSFDMKGLVWTLAGTYRAVAQPDVTLDVLAGARLLDVKQTLRWQLSGDIGPIPAPGRSGSGEVSQSLWDAIIGLKGRLAFAADQQWFFPYYIDVGTGQSHLTWQAIGGIGYSFQWGDIVAAWRYIDYEMKSSAKIDSLSFSGPVLAVAFRW